MPVDLSNDNAEICVVGRPSFSHGIGALTYSACELLARNFPVCLLPTQPLPDGALSLTLPNGRPIPICRDVSTVRVFFYVDVLWNGHYDRNASRVPNHGFRVAHMAYDSDELPPHWVRLLNERFELALFTSRHLESVAINSGVDVPIGTLPIGLDLSEALASYLPVPRGDKIRFGSVGAWHDRKDHTTVLQAFLEEFGNDPSVEFILHSNLVSVETSYARILRLVRRSGAHNIRLSRREMSRVDKEKLIDSIDIMIDCSRGEGYSIPPREALARGSVLVLSDIGAHQDLFGPEGVFRVPTAGTAPARYPEIDGLICGRQTPVEVGQVRRALREAYEWLTRRESPTSFLLRKRRAASFGFDALSAAYAQVVNPQIAAFRAPPAAHASVHLPEAGAERIVGRHARDLRVRNWLIVPAHDGGFFSVFNVFISHLVWQLQEERCQLVLPDWDMTRLLTRLAPALPESFCYGRPEDGNIWCSVFEPLYGLSTSDMSDVALMTKKGVVPEWTFNANLEPWLTYTHAHHLYRSPWFGRFRAQYHRAVRQHVVPVAELRAEVDAMAESFKGRFMVAAHVRHPSHVIEQATGQLPASAAYFARIVGQVGARGLDVESGAWGVFLATDQAHVISEFQERFGERVAVFGDVRRTTMADDAAFEALPDDEKHRLGHQVQHRVAHDPNEWSSRMAWEVVRDAYTMARCDALVHVVSNVATAVAFLNPDIAMCGF